MADWEKFNKALLPEKEDFYSHLNMEDITDADYTHGKRVCKEFEIMNFGKYLDLYDVQSHALLLAYIFENFRNMCLEIYAHFFTASRLVGQAQLDPLTDTDMLLMVEKDITDYSGYSSICKS